MERLNETAQDWVPHVRRLRPDLAWEDVLRIINGPLPEARRWTQRRRETDDRLPAIIAGIKGADPDITLQAICERLESMRERTPRGRTRWQPSSVKMLSVRIEPRSDVASDPNPKNFTGRKLRRRQKVPLVAWG